METLKNPPKPKKDTIIYTEKASSYKKESTSSNIIKNIATKSGLFKKNKLFSKTLNKVSNYSSSNNIEKTKEGIDWLFA